MFGMIEGRRRPSGGASQRNGRSPEGHSAQLILGIVVALLLPGSQTRMSEGVSVHSYWIGDLLVERISLPGGDTAIGPSALPSCIGDEDLRAWQGGLKWRLFETAEDCARHLVRVGAVTAGRCWSDGGLHIRVEGGEADQGRVSECLRVLRLALRSSVTREEDPLSFAYVESENPVKFLKELSDR